MAMVLSRPKFPIIPPLCFSFIKLSLMELLGIHNWLPLNNMPLWIMKSNHLVLSKVLGSFQAFQASKKSGSLRYKVLSSLNPTTSNYISINKICLLLKAFTTLLDLPLLCFKKKVYLYKNSTHFKCLWFNFPLLFKYYSAWWSIYKTLFRQQIMSPFIQCLNYCIKFLIINIILLLCII